jgi:type IV pilus assembly protein PilB
MLVTGKIRELMFASAPSLEIRKAAISQGMSTLYADGMRKVMRGITTFEEVNRVAKRTEQDTEAMLHMVQTG